MKWRRTLAKLHKWTGLTIGLFVAAQCVTGLLLVYEAEINALAAPPGAASPARVWVPAAAADDIGRLLAAIGREYDGYALERIDFPLADRHPFLIHLNGGRPSGDRRLVLAVRHGTHFTVAESRITDALALAFNWHHELAAGSAGRVIVGAFGLSLIFMVVTGLVLWWPGLHRLRGSLKVSRQRHPVTFFWQLHRAIGVLAFPLLAMTLISGTLLALRPWLQQMETVAAPVEQRLSEHDCAPGTLAERLTAATRALPALPVRDLRFTGDSWRLERVLFVNRTRLGIGAPHQVRLAPCRAAVTEVLRADAPRSVYNATLGWLYPVHTGLAFGHVGRAGALAGGGLLAGLLVTGTLLWLRRRRPRLAGSVPGMQ